MAIDIGKGILKISPDLTSFNTDMKASLGQLGTGLSTTVAGAAITRGITTPLVNLGRQAVDTHLTFQQSLAGIAKTVGDVTTITDPLVVGLGEQMRELARNSPIAVEEFNRIGEIAGQLGVEAGDISTFAKAVSDLAVSTELTTEGAAFSLAQFATVLGEDAAEGIGGYADAIVELGNNFATTEPMILSMASRIAGAGSTIGMSSTEILALSTALSQVGIRAEMGGTAISRVMIDIAQVAATGGEKLELYAQTAGMTADEFARLQETDPASALLAFIKGLGQVQETGSGVFDLLEELEFGNIRVRDTLLRSAAAADEYGRALSTASNAVAQGTALQTEVFKFYETDANKLAMANNRIRDSLLDMGESLAPLKVGFSEFVAGTLEGVNALPDPLQRTLAQIVGLAAAIGPLLMTYGGFIQAAAVLKLVRGSHEAAATAASQQAVAVDALTAAINRQSAAATANVAANQLAARAGGSVLAGRGGVLLNPTMIAAGTATGMATGIGTATAGLARSGGRLAPSLAGLGKGLGFALGASLMQGAVQMVETEANTTGRQIQSTISSALTGASLGATVGSIFPGIGTALGAGVGALGGAVVGFFQDTGDEMVDEMNNQIAKIPAGVEATAVQSGIEVGLLLQKGIVLTPDEISEGLGLWQENFGKAWSDTQASLNRYLTNQPSIFEPLFDEETLSILVDGVDAQFERLKDGTVKQVQEAIPPMNWEDIVNPVAADIALSDELGGYIDEFVNKYNLAAISGQLAEGDPTEALATARIIRDQLLNDPESVFQLEADILRLKPELANAFKEFLNIELEGDPNKEWVDRLKGVLSLDDVENLDQFLYDDSKIVDMLVGQQPAIAEQLAATLSGPIREGLQLALEQAFVTEGHLELDQAGMAERIVGTVAQMGINDMIYKAVRNAAYVNLDGVPIPVEGWSFDVTGDNFIINETPVTEAITGEITRKLADWAMGGALNEVMADALKQGIDPGVAVQEALEAKAAEFAEIEITDNLAPTSAPWNPEIVVDPDFQLPEEFGIAFEELPYPTFTFEPMPENFGADLSNDLLPAFIPWTPTVQFDYSSIFGEVVEGTDLGVDATGPANTFTSSFLKGVNDKLGIKSPSTVFKTIGQHVVAGFNTGLAGTIGVALLGTLDRLIADVRGRGRLLSQSFTEGVNEGLAQLPEDTGGREPSRTGGRGGRGTAGQFEYVPVTAQVEGEVGNNVQIDNLHVYVEGTQLDTTEAVGQEVGVAVEKWLSRRSREKVL